MRILAVVISFIWASFSFAVEFDEPQIIIYFDEDEEPEQIEQTILETAPNTIILKRVKRKNIHKSMRANLPKGPIVAYKIFVNEISYENYLGLLIGKEAFFAMKFLLSSMDVDNANCQIALSELVELKQPLRTAEDIYKYFTKGGQVANQPNKTKCIACEDRACQVAGECGHLCICEICSEQLESKKCPICRAKVTKFLKIYSR